jgi:hypothetical protein
MGAETVAPTRATDLGGWSLTLFVPCRLGESGERQAKALFAAWFRSPLPAHGECRARLFPVVVEFTHLGQPRSPGRLGAAFNVYRDLASRLLGVDDGDPRVEWRYGQRASREPGVEVRIFPRGGA